MRLRRLKLLFTPEGRKEAMVDARHWASLYPRRAAVVVLVMLLALGWVWDNLIGRSVEVVDGTTGRPLEGVYAIWHWGGYAPPISIQAATTCSRIRVARTDENGRYRIPYWSWTIVSIFLTDRGSGAWYYHPGYYFVGPESYLDGKNRIALWPDRSPVPDRLWTISRTQSRATCMSFDDTEQRRELEPVFDAMVEEAIAIGGANAKVATYSDILGFRDIFFYGSTEEAKRVREEAKSQREKK